MNSAFRQLRLHHSIPLYLFCLLCAAGGCAQRAPLSRSIIERPRETARIASLRSETQVKPGKDRKQTSPVKTVDFNLELPVVPSFRETQAFLEEIDVETLSEPVVARGTTLEQIISLALGDHPSIGEAAANVDALRGQWIQVGLQPNPFAQYNGEEIGNEDSAGLQIVSIGQTVVTANKLSLSRNVVAAQIEQAQAVLDAMRFRLLSDVRAEFQAALIAQQQLELAEQLLDVAEKSLDSVEAMRRASEASRIELLQAQTAREQAEMSVATAAAQLAAARERLAAVAGLDQLPAARLEGEVGIELAVTDYDQLAAEIVAESPEIAARVAEITRAQRALRLACASITPNVVAQAGVGVDTGTDDTFGAVQVTVPLPLINRNQGTIRQRRAEIAAAERALRRTELDLNFRLAQLLQQYEVGRVQLNRIRDEIVPRAEEMLTLSIQAFEAGESSYLQLLTVQRTLFEARLALLEATASATQAANRIDNYLLQGTLQDP